MNKTALLTHHVAVGYRQGGQERAVLSDVSLHLDMGEIVCLIGPNGAGKSTLLRTLAGLQMPLAGSVIINGQNVHRISARERAQHLAVVLSLRMDAGILAVKDLVALGRHPYTGWRGRLTPPDWAVVHEALTAVGAAHLADRNVSTLSDGEWQKVMIARALAQEPRLLILDEPTAFLDVHHRAEILMLLRSLAHDHGQAVLLSTHDLDLALRIADRLWAIASDRRVYTGAPEDLVLNGVLERTFPSREVTFDVATGTFRVPMRVRGEVRLVGQGIRAYWTQRALERVGWHVVRDPGRVPATVNVIAAGERTAWLVTQGASRRLCHSLLDLTTYLRNISLPLTTAHAGKTSHPPIREDTR